MIFGRLLCVFGGLVPVPIACVFGGLVPVPIASNACSFFTLQQKLLVMVMGRLVTLKNVIKVNVTIC